MKCGLILLLIFGLVLLVTGAKQGHVSKPFSSAVSTNPEILETAPPLASNSAATPPLQPATRLDVPARIARIENGLLPVVTIKGRPPQTMKLAERMHYYKVPGVGIAFFDHGQISWARSYGFADVAGKRTVTSETLFQAASISKPISALAALRLVRDGKLSLDEDVNNKLRTWKVPENEFTKDEKVTLRRILSHSAGLTVHGFSGYASGQPLPTLIQILNGEKPANNGAVRVGAVPGRAWDYSGGGYVILQMLLTDVTQQPFPRTLNSLVLRPAGMKHSTFQQPLPKPLWSAAAIPYHGNGEPVRGGWHTYPEMAAAGLWTTPSDLARLAIEVQNEYLGRSDKILAPKMMREALTRQKDEYGLGFTLAGSGQNLRFWHDGSNEGFRCDLEAYTETGQGVVLMTNSDQGISLISEIERAIATEYGWPGFEPKERVLAKIDPAVLPSYTGVYDLGGVVKLTVTLNEGRLYLRKPDREPQEMFPESEKQFFVLSDQAVFSFEMDQTGAVTRMIIHFGSQTYEAKKLL